MSTDFIFNYLTTGQDYKKLDAMQRIEVQLFIYIFGIINQQFKWEGLPPEIKSYNVEKVLNMYGQGVLFNYKGQYAFCSAVNSSSLNIYGEPVKVQPIAINGMSFDVVNVNTNLDSEGNLKGEEYEKEAFKRLHQVILDGFDSVKDLVRQNIEKVDHLEGDELEKKVKKHLEVL